MTFAPAVPLGGLPGLHLLDATYDRQYAAFSKDPTIARDVKAFLAAAPSIKTPADLVQTPAALRVVLGAVGLGDATTGKALVRRVLEQDPTNLASLVNRLSNPAWQRLASLLGFDSASGTSALSDPATVQKIADLYTRTQFDDAVGQQEPDLELALQFRQGIGAAVGGSADTSTKWFKIIGSTPLRTVVLGALGLPQSFSKLDVDTQAKMLSQQEQKLFGTSDPAALADPATTEKVVQRYLAIRSAATGPGPNVPGATALAILTGATSGVGAVQGSGLGGVSIANLVLSAVSGATTY